MFGQSFRFSSQECAQSQGDCQPQKGGERERGGREREKQSGREKEEGKDNRGKEKEMGVAEVEEKEMSVEVVWVERKTEREQ